MPLIRKNPSQAPSGPQDWKAVLTALTGGTSQERWAAARAAAEAPGGVEALSQALSCEDDARVREAIFTSLVRIRTAESVRAVLPHLRSNDAQLRTGALDALRAMPEAVAPQLPSLLGDPDPDVRLLACDLARGLPAAAAAPLLCDVLGTETEANVCAAAVEVLAEIGGPEALPVLARCADRFPGDPFLGFSVRAAAGRIGSGAAEPDG